MADRDWGEIAREVVDERAQGLRAARLSTGGIDPDAAARANALSSRTGKPFGVVAANLANYEQQDHLDRVAAVGGRSPVVGDFLSDPRRMALAGEDAEKLEQLADALKVPGDAGPESLLGKTVYSLFGPLMQGEGGRKLGMNLDDFSATVGASAKSVLAAAGEWMAEFERDEAAYAGGADVDDASLARDARLAASRGAAAEAERADMAKRAAQARSAADAIVQSYPDNSPGYHAMGIARSLPLMAAAVATRSPAAGAIAIGAGTAADQRSDALAGGATPGQATASGLVHGTLEGSMDAITLGIARWGVGPVKDALVARFGENIATRLLARASESAPGRLALATAEGAITEIPTTLGQMASDELILGKKYTAADYLRGVRDSAIQGGAMSGGMYAATSPLRAIARSEQDRQLALAIESAEANDRLRAATELASEIGLGQRSPADFAAFAAQTAGEEQRVYLPAEQARVLFQSDALLELVGSEAALAEQMASGELSISLAQWMAVVPRLSNREEIVRHARRTADGMSPAELESFDPDALFAELAGEADTAEAAARATPEQQEARQRIEQDVMGQLIATGRYSDAAAEAQAKLFAAGITTMAQRAGQDPGALYDRYMGGIRSGRADGQADPRATRPFMESGRLDALLESIRSPDGGPTARQVFGPSLSSWLVSEGGLQEVAGELRARDAGKLRPGLVSRSGMPMDRARELAVEAGFLPEGAELADFLDALDADLRGETVYSEALGNQERQRFDLDRQSLLDAIDNTPALRDLPAEEFRALTNQQIADMLTPAETFGQQARRDQTETPEFKRWFGDSKVVDADGKPRVVYHGTRANFDTFEVVADADLGHGYYFTPDPDAAQAWASRHIEQQEDGSFKRPTDGLNVMPVFLSITNPASYVDVRRVESELGQDYSPERVTAALRDEGFDGVMDEEGGEYVAFSPSQIKSATGNAGTFDPRNPSILFQGARDDLASPEFREWFGDRTIDQLEADYAAMPETDGGRRIDTDLVRELAPAYVADRSLSQALHPYASRLTKELFARALARPVAEGRNPIVQFLAGGGGSGKSTATAGAVSAANADIIFDGTLSNLANARRDIEASLASGRGVLVDFVYRSPENSVEGAIGRAIRKGRPVPVWALAEAHAGAPETVKALAKAYDGDGRVLIDAFWNDGALDEVRQMPVEEIPNVDRDQAERIFRAAVERAAEEGRAPERLRDAFLAARDQPQDAGGVQENRPEEPAGNAVTETPPTGGVSASGPRTLFQRAADGVRSLFQRKPARPENRGQIAIFPDRRMAISLFESADRSTFLHETGHFFLEVYSDLAAAPDASQQVRDDFADLLNWMGVESADKIGRDQHEQFARAFEHYLAEGKAPSPELQSVFSQFMAWLRGIYRSLQNLDVNLTDDVRGIMDRMLAADEQIELAQARQGMEPLARTAEEARALGMTEQQWQDYIAKVEAASEDAKAEVLSKLVQSQQRALKRWWKDERATVLAEVLAEYGNLPAERLARVLAGAKTYADGTPIADAERVHLDRQALVEGWGDAYLARLRGLYRNEGGVSPDLLAPLYGFESGDALVKALANRGDMRARAEAEADARMRERHGDPFTDGTLPELAMEAVHSNRRVQLLERELKVLADLAGQPAPSRRVFSAAAREIVQGKSSREVRPNDHLVAERRAARVALQAAVKGDFAAALQAKRQQAFNAAMFKAATDAREEFGRIERLAKDLTQKSSQERLAKAGNGFLPQVNGILAAYGFGKADPGDAGSLMAWLDGLQDSGEVTAVAESIMARLATPAPFRDIPLAEAREFADAVRNLSHLASRQNQVLAGARKVDKETAVTELLERPKSVLGEAAEFVSEMDLPLAQRARRAVVNKLDDITRVENIIEKLDGGETGPWHDFIWHAQEQAEIKKNELMRRVGGLLKKLHESLPPDWADNLTKPVTFKGVRISRGRLISMALNMGNAGNRQRLMNGGFATNTRAIALSEADLTVLGNLLTTAEWRYVQGMWDAIGSMRPDIEAMNNRMGGVPVKFVEAVPLTVRTADGQTIELPGGYFPIAYDSSRSRVGDVQATEDAMRALMAAGAARAGTGKGYTKGRAEEVSAALLLDYGQVVHRHLDQVMTDLAYRETVRDVQMLLKDPRIRSYVSSRLSESAWRSLMGGLAHSVVGSTAAAGSVSNWRPLVDGLLANTTVAALAIRPDIAMGNYGSALLQGMDRAGRMEVMKALAEFQANRAELTQAIMEKSPFMAARLQEVDHLYSSAISQVRGDKWKGRHAAYTRVLMSLHRFADADVARVVWLARYGMEKRKGTPEVDAVKLADKAVRMTQTATGKKDLSTFERDAALRQTRQYMGPMFVIFGRLRAATEGSGATRTGSSRMVSLLLQWLLAPAAFAILSGRLPQDDDHDGEKDWMMWLVKEIGLFPVQTIPMVRDVASLADAWISGRSPNARSAPMATVLANIGKAGSRIGKRIEEGEFDDAKSWLDFTADLLQLVGPATGLPATQAKRWSKALGAVWDDPNTGALELTQMAVYGEAPFYADGEALPDTQKK